MSKQGKYLLVICTALAIGFIAAIYRITQSEKEAHLDSTRERKATPVERAKRTVDAFFAEAKPYYVPGIEFPQLPEVDDKTLQAINTLKEASQTQYLAKIAALLVRYAREEKKVEPTGTPIEREHLLVREFVSTVFPSALLWDELNSTSLAEWIFNHRDKLASYAQLDREIERYKKLQMQEKSELWLGLYVGAAIEKYAKDHNQTYPDSLNEVKPYINYGSEYITDESIVKWMMENVEYVRKADKLDEPGASKIPVAYDKTLFKTHQGTTVLFADGRIEFVDINKLDAFGIN